MFYYMDKIASEKYLLFLTTKAKIMRVSWGAILGYYLWEINCHGHFIRGLCV